MLAHMQDKFLYRCSNFTQKLKKSSSFFVFLQDKAWYSTSAIYHGFPVNSGTRCRSFAHKCGNQWDLPRPLLVAEEALVKRF